ncbi:hypothetical protein CS022_18235 [Veronia nyctiphanis]|uniref:Uncharacterized protein n=2 Tax=Veronia nyctiphanis TaxID=1278244 RepID=A0A4Q0YNP4_9GAMM|nr:hypothetical protein CS022_17955 [Veronia nyctiphanis]RXJ72065.1 hypothetical protein CS022_18235 [Veronia nyctiphanis]
MTQDTDPGVSLEEHYKGYVIYLENNADQHTGGYEYSVSDGDNILTEGLEFDSEQALQQARDFVDALD